MVQRHVPVREDETKPVSAMWWMDLESILLSEIRKGADTDLFYVE